MLEQDIQAAFEYAYPLFAVTQTRWQALRNADRPDGQAPNTVRHERALSDHRSRWITTPNNDTLYSNAWLDLSRGPVRIRVGTQPAGRYWSLAFMDACTNHFAIVGQRLDGTGPADVTLIGPGQRASADAPRVIQAPGLDVWMLGRWLVDGPHDLPQCHAMQDSLHLHGPATGAWDEAPAALDPLDPANFLQVVNHALQRNPPPAADTPLLARLARVGLGAGVGADAAPAWQDLPEAVRAAWQNGIAAAYQKVRSTSAKGRRDMQGWVASAPDMGDFGSNFALRASVAMGGLAALVPQEAMYFVRFHDDAQQALDGQHRYVLHIPASDIPTHSFWSFTMYQPSADGRRFFVDNPIGRYAIGNRTPGLQRRADGALDITIAQQAPSTAADLANWLPCPEGPFQLALRAYLPQAALREGRAPMPRLIRL